MIGLGSDKKYTVKHMRFTSQTVRLITTHGEEGSSRRVAEISASMIWPGVISIGIPRPGVLGRGGELTFVTSLLSSNTSINKD